MRRGEGEGGGLLSPAPIHTGACTGEAWLAWGRLGGLLHP